QQHGFSSVPPVGAHGVGVTIGSNRDMLMALGGEMPAKRPKSLGVGNTALYNADGSIWKLVGKDATFDAEGNCTMTVKSLTVNCGGVSMTISAD
ncbi:phage baseplate assembly protein, partial [Acinetobacter baumannii]